MKLNSICVLKGAFLPLGHCGITEWFEVGIMRPPGNLLGLPDSGS